MDIHRSIPCDFCDHKAVGVWGRHLDCWECFHKREPANMPVEEFEQGLEDLLTD
jgi:hypothetical protein